MSYPANSGATYMKLMKLVVGPRGGRKWTSKGTLVNGSWNVTQPGTYRVVNYVNSWASSGPEIVITEEEIGQGNQYFNVGVLVP